MTEEIVEIAKVEIKTEKTIENIVRLEKEIKKLKDELDKYSEEEKKTNEAAIEKNAIYKNLQKEVRVYNDILQTSVNLESEEVVTLKKLTAENKLLAKERDNVNIATEEGQNKVKELNKQIDANNELIKQNSDKQKQNKMNVGNYTDSIKEAAGGVGGFVKQFDGISESAGNVIVGFQGITKANPIGIFLSMITILTNLLSTSSDFGNTIKTIFAGVKAAIETAIGSITKYAGGFIKILKGDFSAGFDDMVGAVTGLADGFIDAYNSGEKLVKMQKELNKAQTDSISVMASLKNQQDILSQAAGDGTLSLNEQLAATNELQKSRIESSKIAEGLAKKELANEIMKIQMLRKNNKIVGEDQQKAYQEALAKLIEANGQTKIVIMEAQSQRRQIGLDALQQELDWLVDGTDAKKTANEVQIANDKLTFGERRKILGETVSMVDKAYLDQVKAIESFYKINIDQDKLLAETDQKRVTQIVKGYGLQDGIQTRLLEILRERTTAVSDLKQAEQDLNTAETEYSLQALSDAIEIQKLQSVSKLQGQKELTLAIIADEQARLEQLNALDMDYLNKQLEQKQITQTAYDLAAVQKQTELNSTLQQLGDDYYNQETEKQKQRDAIDSENKLAASINDFDMQLELTRQRNEIRRQEEIAFVEKIGADVEAIEKKYALADQQLFLQTQMAKADVASQFAGNIAKIFGENTKVGRIAAITSTTIDTFKSATAAYSSLAGIPVVGPVLGAAAAGAALSAGYANVKKIASTKSGLPGDSASGGGGASGGSIPTAVSAPSTSQSVAPEIGKGIVSRETVKSTSAQSQTQVAVVVDQVTAAQNTQSQTAAAGII